MEDYKKKSDFHRQIERLSKIIIQKDFELLEVRNRLWNELVESKEARREAEDEKNKTLTIIANFSDGLLVFNNENKLSLINPQAEKFLQAQAGEVSGMSMPKLKRFQNLKLLVGLLERESMKVFRKELPIVKNLILEVSTVPMVDKEEKMGILVVLHDVTREKTVERLKTEFVSLAAHQLRTPLSAIKWALKMLLDGDAGKMNKGQTELAVKTYESNERMINLINDLLDVARIEEGKYLFKPVLAGIDTIAKFVVDSYKKEVDKKGLILKLDIKGKKLPQVKIDVEKIRLVFQNLIENAIRYTPPGGSVSVLLSQKEGNIECQVSDTGVGIPEDQKARVFLKFFRGQNVIKMETEGSGLGLFITRNIIEAHGGQIWFESKEGKGSAFFFTIPVSPNYYNNFNA